MQPDRAQSRSRATTDAPTTRRVASLDGLRGVAAVVVVIHHCLLTIAPLASPYLDPDWSTDGPLVVDLLVASPLHVFWDGTAAVMVFFVLSGVVLTLPVLKSGAFDWINYFPRRLVRLYVPIWAAVALAALVIMAFDRTGTDLQSTWVQARANDVTRHALLMDLTLLRGSGGLASPLWSLKWELWFSLLLPLYIWLGLALRRQAWLVGIALIGLLAYGGYADIPALRYLPVFAIGVLLAVRADQVHDAVTTFSARRWVGVVTVAVALICLPWMTLWFWQSATVYRTLLALSTVGAVALVVAAMHAPAFRGFLVRPTVQYLGTISFALYLVHEPLVITIAAMFGEGMQWLSLPIAIAVSVGVADVFFRVVERPSHRLSRMVGAGAADVRRRMTAQSGRTSVD